MLVAFVNRDDAQHATARRLVAELARGSHGQLYTSDFVLAESLNFLRQRVRRAAVAETLVRMVMGDERTPPVVPELLRVHGTRFAEALALYLRRWEAGLSLTDWTIVVLMREHRVDSLVTFDRGFEAWVEVLR